MFRHFIVPQNGKPATECQYRDMSNPGCGNCPEWDARNLATFVLSNLKLHAWLKWKGMLSPRACCDLVLGRALSHRSYSSCGAKQATHQVMVSPRTHHNPELQNAYCQHQSWTGQTIHLLIVVLCPRHA